jgi:hypothetical protein
MENAVDVADGLGGQPAAPVPPSIVQQRPVERRQVSRGTKRYHVHVDPRLRTLPASALLLERKAQHFQ